MHVCSLPHRAGEVADRGVDALACHVNFATVR
jgi:hypothetical protein